MRTHGTRLALLLVTAVAAAALAACGEDAPTGPGTASDPASDPASAAVPALVAAPLEGPPDLLGSTEPESTSITSYDADLVVDETGDLAVAETLTVLFPDEGKHGIFRYWDTEDAYADRSREVRDLEVSRDGAPERVDLTTEETDEGSFQVARIGDPDVTLPPGEHVFEIDYAYDDVLLADGSVLYWNLVPAGWQQPIDGGTLTVTLPRAATSVHCGIGLAQDLEPCDVTGEGTATLTVEVPALPPRTPLTVRALLEAPSGP